MTDDNCNSAPSPYSPGPTLRATHDHVIMRPIRVTMTDGARGAKVHVPEGAKSRLPLVRILDCGPECCSGVQVNDVVVFLIDPTAVDPTKEFVYGEIDFLGEVLWIAPEGCLGPVVDNPESLLANMVEGVDEMEQREHREEMAKAASTPPLVVARPKVN